MDDSVYTIGVSGVIPMMISSKQGGFYIYSSIFYYRICNLNLPILNYIFNSLVSKENDSFI